MMIENICLVIVSGGSEIVSLAIAEAAEKSKIKYAVISTTPNSLFEKHPGCFYFKNISPYLNCWSQLSDKFIGELDTIKLKTSAKIVIFPSEDGSLRLLNELKDEILKRATFSRARSLKLGGVDKAEVIEHLEGLNLSSREHDAQVINSPGDAIAALDAFGSDAIFKPALKPLNMDLSGLGRGGIKVVTQSSNDETNDSIIKRLEKVWKLSERWIVQPRLKAGPGMEKSVCLASGRHTRACQVTEQLKYPQMGGTALWVKTDKLTNLVPQATAIAQALDCVGICEVSFLPDTDDKYRLVELNPRPWLQVGLIEFSGFNIIESSIYALLNIDKPANEFQVDIKSWVHIERIIISLITGGISIDNATSILKETISRDTIVAGYSTALPKMKSRLLGRNVRKIVGR